MSMLQMLLGAGGKAELKVEDVFNTTAFTGNGSTGQSFITGLDLAGKGGMVWHKERDTTGQHHIWDTERGTSSVLRSNDEGAPWTFSNSITFNSNGHSMPTASGNEANAPTISWSFREAEKFFDIVTYTGDNTEPRDIPHNLGCVPGLILVKRISGSDQYWAAYHVAAGATHYMKLNDNVEAYDNEYFWGDTTPTDEEFTVHSSNSVNENGSSYVAYLFANDEDFIKCGSYTGNNSTTGPVVNVGFEPQWLLIKGIDYAGEWAIQDTARGINVSSPPRLMADSQGAELSSADNNIQLSSTGFQIKGTGGTYNDNGITYGYVAIKKPD